MHSVLHTSALGYPFSITFIYLPKYIKYQIHFFFKLSFHVSLMNILLCSHIFSQFYRTEHWESSASRSECIIQISHLLTWIIVPVEDKSLIN